MIEGSPSSDKGSVLPRQEEIHEGVKIAFCFLFTSFQQTTTFNMLAALSAAVVDPMVPIYGAVLLSISLAISFIGRDYLIFAYNCFLKPFISKPKGSTGGQQDALEAFYKGQAAIYDSTRSTLLRGRDEMLALAAAQLRLKNEREGFRKRVWVDVSFPELLFHSVELIY